MPAKRAKVKKQNKKSTKKTAPKKTKVVGPAIDIYNLAGKLVEKKPVPKEIFAAKINPVLEALAVRVYLANQHQGTVSTKTRGEVAGSTRKLYRQKGTGRARQGSIRAPHRVGGGVVFGPKPRNFSLKLPKKAKRAALLSALSSKLKESKVLAVADFDKLEPKTKKAMAVFEKLPVSGKKLIVLENTQPNVLRATSNLPKTSCLLVNNLNTYAVLDSDSIIFSQNALQKLQERYQKGDDHATS